MTEILNDSHAYSSFLPEHGVDWVKTKIAENEELLSTLQKEFEASQIQQGDGLNAKRSQSSLIIVLSSAYAK
ncbi:hypothetical protein N7537_001471 [Penicillium hordei]|uniref:Uncharacterized protein n=1 Tax=Penicillium hordei TaxID=40994 RepID=A0AAD6EFI4_9EURO|nr:uncharacterized protein N7537_001471 [Penicillium hordei]KAJ5616357.1 hypothetical protein N7537_001471 [Penicillium hordei]